MIDHSVTAPEGGRTALPSHPSQRFMLRPATVYAISAMLMTLIAIRLAVSEGGLATVLLAMLVCATSGALLMLVTRRVLVAATMMTAQIAVVTFASWMKLKYMNMVLHAYDIAFYLTSSTTLSFLVESYTWEASWVLVVLLLTTAACVVAFRIDPVRVSRRTAGIAFALFAAGAVATAASVEERRHSLFEYEGMYLSSFYRSWAETAETLWRGQLIEAAPEGEAPPLLATRTCNLDRKPPHIIVIHHESIVQPSLFPTLGHDRRLDSFFKSDNGEAYRLKVETYGGASVLTEFSVLTGLSTYSFGGMRLFVQRLMSGKIEDTIPKVLEKCGYRNVLFYPMLKSFTSADRFFTGIGINEIFDLKDQGAQRVNERDRFYYDNTMNEVGRHIAASSRPLFAFVETMATHWPYHEPFEPQLAVPGGGPGTHPELHEYLRRVWLAHLDYGHLRSELARRFPNERFLIVRYGDHHPMATRVLLGYEDGTEAEDVLLDRNSIGFQTFFAVNGVGFTPEHFDSPPLLDVPYLGTILLEAAGVPLPETYRKRRKLMTACGGLWFDCRRRELVLSFHRQLLDAGLVKAR
ncbi:MAG: sulfatase-like hydrolase/transferase [Hyphomicrobiaceae bacterium]|nr:sulfatase-like hydrolase/transferase [Hyphomicrobiaceae bacterium]